MTTPRTLSYNGYTSVLLRYNDGQPALWVTDEYLSGRADAPGTYTLNDINTGDTIDGDEDLDDAITEWKRCVDWDDGQA